VKEGRQTEDLNLTVTQVEIPIEITFTNYPDVYYIIPDTYVSNEILTNFFSYDNKEFLRELRNRGFYTYESSYANYHHSILSISSVLNYSYWEGAGGSPRQLAGYLTHRVDSNRVVDTFKFNSYEYVLIGNWWGVTSSDPRADLSTRFLPIDEFTFSIYTGLYWHDLFDLVLGLGSNSVLRKGHHNQFEYLKMLPSLESPTFTFCHLTLPHSPFVFWSDGSSMSTLDANTFPERSVYLEQLKYTSYLLLDAIDTILSGSNTPPIIIILSDEGFPSSEWFTYLKDTGGLKGLEESRPDIARIRQGNLYAVYNPYTKNPPPISPVNIFPYVFSSISEIEVEYLPDRYFLKSMRRFSESFIDVTDFFSSASIEGGV
jgi:hypothetical protein